MIGIKNLYQLDIKIYINLYTPVIVAISASQLFPRAREYLPLSEGASSPLWTRASALVIQFCQKAKQWHFCEAKNAGVSVRNSTGKFLSHPPRGGLGESSPRQPFGLGMHSDFRSCVYPHRICWLWSLT